MWLNSLRQGAKNGFFSKDKNFIKRWPANPKIAFFGPQNTFKDELSQRYGTPFI